jgi:phage portal protein BeeE
VAIFRRRPKADLDVLRDIYPYSLDAWASQFFSFNGNMYGLGLNQTLAGSEVTIEGNFTGLVRDAYKSNGVVFACMLVRMLTFSEARFAYRRLKDGRPGDLHGGGSDMRAPAVRDLELLRTPWPNGTTGDLLTRMIQDADLAGNFFATRQGNRLFRMRPDWVSIVLGKAAENYDAEIAGYLYHPGGKQSGVDPVSFDVSEVVHFAPIPDPIAPFRGMSWLTPVIREIGSDSAANDHKKRFFENGATVNLVVQTNQSTKENFDRWVEAFREKHESVSNAYKTLFLASGQDATPVGTTPQQIDFKNTQGMGETRIAAAAGVPPVIVGLSEGLQSATYSNYAQARRRFADATLRPTWRNAAASLATVVRVPADSELWYDDRDIPLLHEDALDATNIRQTQAASIKLLVDSGFEPGSVVEAVTAGDMTRLVHSGLVSVQLLPPGTEHPTPNTPPAPPANGSGTPKQMMPMGGK